jgi:hypothetical protein
MSDDSSALLRSIGVFPETITAVTPKLGHLLPAKQEFKTALLRHIAHSRSDCYGSPFVVVHWAESASRRASIPHAAVCGGRGRCTTCRIRVLRGVDTLPPPSASEQALLGRLLRRSECTSGVSAASPQRYRGASPAWCRTQRQARCRGRRQARAQLGGCLVVNNAKPEPGSPTTPPHRLCRRLLEPVATRLAVIVQERIFKLGSSLPWYHAAS